MDILGKAAFKRNIHNLEECLGLVKEHTHSSFDNTADGQLFYSVLSVFILKWIGTKI